MVLKTKSAVIIFVICSIVTISCNPNKKNMPLISIDIQAIPVVNTEDYTSLISDSGNVYRINAKVCQIYSNDADPYSYFPKGIHVEQLDSLFQAAGDIVADTAYYFDRKELWRVVGNVVVKNLEGDIFETSELFWNVKVPQNVMNAFYTDKPVKILKPDNSVVYGDAGFTADQSLRVTRLFSGSADLYIDESTDSTQQKTTVNDSILLQ